MDKPGRKALNDHGEKGGNILSHIDMFLATSQIAEMKKTRFGAALCYSFKVKRFISIAASMLISSAAAIVCNSE